VLIGIMVTCRTKSFARGRKCRKAHGSPATRHRAGAALTERSFNRMLIERSFSVQCSKLLQVLRGRGEAGPSALLLLWPASADKFFISRNIAPCYISPIQSETHHA